MGRRLHVRTHRRRLLLVAAVLDLCSRRIVGCSMGANMTAQLVMDALLMAIWRRGTPRALRHHSDQGSTRARTSADCSTRMASPAA